MSPAKKRAAGKRLYTLTEISDIADISMPTLQKYKKQHASRIPSVGEGRRQRYPKAAIKVFRDLKEESLARRGRGGRRKKKRTKAVGSRRRSRKTEGLLSLQQIQKLTGISYPTLLRYVKLHLDKLPHEGSGRTRRYYPEAVPVFRELRAQSPRGRRASKPGVSASAGQNRAIDRRLAKLERTNASIERQLRELTRLVRRPMKVTLKR